MLGRTLPSGSDAISFHNTLYRVSELCWIKAVRLSPPELAVRIISLILALIWVLVMKSAKGTFYNVEFLLGLFPLVLAWTTAGSLRIGCSGDFEESYEERRGVRGTLFRGWIDALRTKEPGWLHLHGGSYDILLNPQRIAWIRPCYQWQVYPLIVVAAFVAYLYVIGLNLAIPSYPVIDDFQILSFEGSTGSVKMVSYLIVATALAAFGLSIKRSMEICGTGGVQDVFPTTAEEQERLVDMVAGRISPVVAKPVVRGSKGQAQTMEVAVAPSKPAVVNAPVPVTESVKPEEPKPLDP